MSYMCETKDVIIGFVLMFMTFILSIFVIDSYTKLEDKSQGGKIFQLIIAILTLVVTVLYFIYNVVSPVMKATEVLRKVKPPQILRVHLL